MRKGKLVFIFLTTFAIFEGGILSNDIYVKSNNITCLSTKDYSENSIKKINNYIIYYGSDFKGVMEKLKTYDLVIINPLEEGADSALKELHNANIKVYGYFSAIEIPDYDKEYLKKISKDEKLNINNKYINHWESNLLGDISNIYFREEIINLIEKRIVNKYDGVFIDTVDDLDCLDDILRENYIEVNNIEKIKKEQQEGCINFFKELKSKFNNISIIQNRGFDILNKGSSEYVDAILYEDIRKSDDEEFYKYVKNILDDFTKKKNGVVMALPNDKKYYLESKRIAKENNWLYYETNSYDTSNIVDGFSFRINIADNSKDYLINNTGSDNEKKSVFDINNIVSNNSYTCKERRVKEKLAVTKIKENLSKLTKTKVEKSISFPEISMILEKDVESGVVHISFDKIKIDKKSMSFKIRVNSYSTEDHITDISAKLIYN